MTTFTLPVLPVLLHIYAVMQRRVPIFHRIMPPLQFSDWISSRTQFYAFRAGVWRNEHGQWEAAVYRRSGYEPRHYRYCRMQHLGIFPSRRTALKASGCLAHQLATLRYRYH